jgi:hypothetical protein
VDSTSTTSRQQLRDSAGLGLLELLIGLTLALCLALAVAPLLTSLQKSGVEEADRTVQTLQARVAFGRFEQDMRLAGAAGSLFPTSGAVLEAGESRVVLLVRREPDSVPILVEWELTEHSLMRRWGPCPPTRPKVFGTSMFIDNKTMLEGVQGGSRLVFLVGEEEADSPLKKAALVRVDRIALELRTSPPGQRGSIRLSTMARVGR